MAARQAQLKLHQLPRPVCKGLGTHAGDMICEIALAIEMGADAVDIGKNIHLHPTLGQSDRHRGRSGAWQLHRFATCS